jgi:lipoprotein-anchoring transpeptidase ErfK/SrfK
MNELRSRSLRQPALINDRSFPVTTPLALLATGAFALATAATAATPATTPTPGSVLTPEAVNAAIDTPVESGKGAAVLRAQVLLDRAHFSPGEIDGAFGSNVRRAISGFQERNGLPASGKLDAPTWTALNLDKEPALSTVTLSAADVGGPFEKAPSDMMEKSKMKALVYASALEALAEKYHSSPALLQQLNPGKSFAAGESIVAPNVASASALPEAAKVVVDKSDSTVSLVDAGGRKFAQFPATTGSEHDPLPLGDWKIQGVSKNPEFHYNPDLFWDAKSGHSKATIAAGPNNPVGVAWIDLSKEHYGIHGTPEPSTIAKTQSHGCIRLTNWDVLAMAAAVKPGTPALLQE